MSTASGTSAVLPYPPLYAFARRQGPTPEDAEDLVQSFLAEFLERKAVRSADPARGRFRSFLLVCFKRYITNVWRRGQTAARAGGKPVLSLDTLAPEDQYAREARAPFRELSSRPSPDWIPQKTIAWFSAV